MRHLRGVYTNCQRHPKHEEQDHIPAEHGSELLLGVILSGHGMDEVGDAEEQARKCAG
jgi:hypothetical protein